MSHQFTIAIEEPTKSALLCVSDKAARHRHSHKHNRTTALQSALHSAVQRGYQFTNEHCNFSLVSATMNKSKITFVLGEATVFSFNPSTGVGKVAPINDNETVFQMPPTKKDGDIGFAQGTNNWKVLVNDEVVFSGCVDCFDQIMAAHTAVADQKSSHRWTVRLPLYSTAGLEECTRLRLPVHEVHLALGSKQHRSKKTFEIKIKEVLFYAFGSPTSAWFNTQGQHAQRLVAQVSHTGMYSAASFSSYKAPEPTMLGASELQMRGTKTVQSILAALGNTTVEKYSLSVYQRDRAIFAIESGGDTSRHRYALGSVSEVVFAAAFVDYVNKSGIVKSPIVDFNDPDLLETLLERSGASHVLTGLRSLYGSTQRPSISQLLCHSAGLPAHAPLLAEHLKQAVLRGSGFTEKQQQVFSLEATFGQMLAQDIQLEAPPGARVSPSPLGYALLSFALPNWHESTSLNATLDALGLSGFEYGNDPSNDAYQGIYRLGSGMTLDAQTLARALSGGNNTWFRSSVSQKRADGLDFLQELLVPRYSINKKAKLSASFGWTHSVVQSTRGASVHVASSVSTLVSGETVAAIMIPALEVSAVFALKNTSTLVQFNAAAMKQLVDSVLDTQLGSGGVSTFKYHLPPFHQSSVVFSRQCSDALHTGCIVEQEDTTLNSYYNGEFVSVFDEEAVTMSIGIEFTQPGDKRRYVLTLKWHDRTTKWLLAFDKHGSVAPNKEERGVYRIVDPTNQKFLGAYVYFQSIASAKRASTSVIREPIISFDGRVFARAQLVEKIRRFGEPSALEQRQSRVVEIKRREDQRAVLAAKKTKKAQRKQKKRSDSSDSSSSDSSSSDSDEEPAKDQDDAATKRFKQAIANQEDFFLVLSSIDNDTANETASPDDIGGRRRPYYRPPPPRRHHGHRSSGFWPGWLAGTATGLALSPLAPVYSYPYVPPGHYYDPYYDSHYYGPRYAW